MRRVTIDDFNNGTGLENGAMYEVEHSSGAVEVKQYHSGNDYPFTLVITAVTGDPADTEFKNDKLSDGEIDVTVGMPFVASFEIQDSTGAVVDAFSGKFRMPIVAEDGDTRYLPIEITAGTGQKAIALDASGEWKVTEALVNSKLPEEQKMNFSGVTVYVLENEPVVS